MSPDWELHIISCIELCSALSIVGAKSVLPEAAAVNEVAVGVIPGVGVGVGVMPGVGVGVGVMPGVGVGVGVGVMPGVGVTPGLVPFC
jgi:hypothetical protein